MHVISNWQTQGTRWNVSKDAVGVDVTADASNLPDEFGLEFVHDKYLYSRKDP